MISIITIIGNSFLNTISSPREENKKYPKANVICNFNVNYNLTLIVLHIYLYGHRLKTPATYMDVEALKRNMGYGAQHKTIAPSLPDEKQEHNIYKYGYTYEYI